MRRYSLRSYIIIFMGAWVLSHPALSQSHIDSIIDMGDDLISLNDYKGAEDQFDQALEFRDDYVPALEAKIRVLLLRNKYNKAQKLAEEAKEKHVGQPSFHLYLGKALMGKERYGEALDHLSNALELSGEEDQRLKNKIYVNRGAAFQKQQDYEHALENYSEALTFDKSNPNVFLYRGNIYYRQENYEEAIADFEQVLELDPNNHVAQYNIGMSHFRNGEKLPACDAFHKACELGNKNACKMVISKCLRNSESQ